MVRNTFSVWPRLMVLFLAMLRWWYLGPVQHYQPSREDASCSLSGDPGWVILVPKLVAQCNPCKVSSSVLTWWSSALELANSNEFNNCIEQRKWGKRYKAINAWGTIALNTTWFWILLNCFCGKVEWMFQYESTCWRAVALDGTLLWCKGTVSHW